MLNLRRFALALHVALLTASAPAQHIQDCERVTLDQRSIRLVGTFTAERPERFCCLHSARLLDQWPRG